MSVVNPPIAVGPPLVAVPLQLAQVDGATFNLRLEGRGAKLVRAVVLPKGLNSKSKDNLRKVKLSRSDAEALQRVVDNLPELSKVLDLKTAYVGKGKVWLASISPKTFKSPALVFLMNPRARTGTQSVVIERRVVRLLPQAPAV
jgi:hypothetical protein